MQHDVPEAGLGSHKVNRKNVNTQTSIRKGRRKVKKENDPPVQPTPSGNAQLAQSADQSTKMKFRSLRILKTMGPKQQSVKI